MQLEGSDRCSISQLRGIDGINNTIPKGFTAQPALVRGLIVEILISALHGIMCAEANWLYHQCTPYSDSMNYTHVIP